MFITSPAALVTVIFRVLAVLLHIRRLPVIMEYSSECLRTFPDLMLRPSSHAEFSVSRPRLLSDKTAIPSLERSKRREFSDSFK